MPKSKVRKKAARKKRNSGNKVKTNVTPSQAIRDVLIHAINKGQLIGLLLGVAILILVIKVPEGEVSILIKDIIDRISGYCTWSYVLIVVLVLGWFFHAKYMRRKFSEEYERIGNEKSELQSKLSGVNYESSNDY